jgi:hypothetical protein
MIIPCRSFGFFLQPRKRWNYEVACFCKVLVFCGCFSASWDEYFAADAGQVFVTLEPPVGTMKMGETPAFSGNVTNIGKTPLEGLVIYLSLVSLKPGEVAR